MSSVGGTCPVWQQPKDSSLGACQKKGNVAEASLIIPIYIRG